jgi:hypothetical protein
MNETAKPPAWAFALTGFLAGVLTVAAVYFAMR